MAKSKVVFPDECCGVCKYSVMVEKDLSCYALPPQVVPDENGDYTSLRGLFVLPSDKACIHFKGREHA